VAVQKGGRPGGQDPESEVREVRRANLGPTADAATVALKDRTRQEIEAALQASEERARLALDIANIGTFWHDMSTDVVTFDPIGQAQWGFKHPEVLMAEVVACFHPEDAERVRHEIAAAHLGESDGNFATDYRVVRPDGEVRWFAVRARVHFTGRDKARRPVRAVGTILDITPSKRVEEALRASEHRFRTFVDHATDAFFLHGEGGVILDVNSQACESLGYSREELVGRTPADFDTDFFPALHEQLVARLNEGETVVFDSRHRRKDGSEFPVEIRVRPFWEGGRLLRVALVRDMTERKRLEDVLRQAQKMEAIGRLAGGVAHDFNNLLTVINGCTEMVLDQLGPDAAVRDSLTEVRKAGERAADFTRQLLAFSRKQPLQPRAVDLNDSVAEVTSMLRRIIGDDIELTVIAGTLPQPVFVDPSRLEQALLNLVVNARDAMPYGGRLTIETRSVEVRLPDVGDQPRDQLTPCALLAVTDTGHGMDEPTRAHIFEPFFTTKGPDKGTGLGLASVYGFIRQSGGHVEVQSQAGQGASFKLFLPFAAAGVAVQRAETGRGPVAKGTETVLLVDDDDGVRCLTATVLRSAGYTVLEARDGSEALKAAKNHPNTIHLLVTDLIMPRLSGRQLADRLMRNRVGLKVLFISGYAANTLGEHDPISERSDFLSKPFTPASLAAKVRAVLDGPAR
jgi:PAS domain S-box-containing protein